MEQMGDGTLTLPLLCAYVSVHMLLYVHMYAVYLYMSDIVLGRILVSCHFISNSVMASDCGFRLHTNNYVLTH